MRESSNWRRELDDVVQVGHASAAIWRRLLEYSLDETHARHETHEHVPAVSHRVIVLGNCGLHHDKERHDQYSTMYPHLFLYGSDYRGAMIRVRSQISLSLYIYSNRFVSTVEFYFIMVSLMNTCNYHASLLTRMNSS